MTCGVGDLSTGALAAAAPPVSPHSAPSHVHGVQIYSRAMSARQTKLPGTERLVAPEGPEGAW